MQSSRGPVERASGRSCTGRPRESEHWSGMGGASPRQDTRRHRRRAEARFLGLGRRSWVCEVASIVASPEWHGAEREASTRGVLAATDCQVLAIVGEATNGVDRGLASHVLTFGF